MFPAGHTDRRLSATHRLSPIGDWRHKDKDTKTKTSRSWSFIYTTRSYSV